MITRAILSAEHAQLDALATEMLTVIAAAKQPPTELSALRWRMNHLLMVHLAKEDQYLYPHLQTNGAPRAASLAKRFSQEMGGLAAAYLSYTSQWTAQRMAEDWPGFIADTRKIILALRQRILREERDLYPLIDEASPRQSIRA